jgi:radical SAM superfamily enzyme YgiQ (UPF0313 family)
MRKVNTVAPHQTECGLDALVEGITVRERPKVLLTNYGWPSGVLELGSHIKASGTADAVVYRLEETKAGQLNMLELRKNVDNVLKKHGLSVKDLRYEDVLDISRVGTGFLDRLLEYKPAVVGYQVTVPTLKNTEAFVRVVRRFSDAYVALGGSFVTSIPEKILEVSGADFVFKGEAEMEFERALKIIGPHDRKTPMTGDQCKELMKVRGFGFRWAGRSYVNELIRDGYGNTTLDEAKNGIIAVQECQRVYTIPELRQLDRPYLPLNSLRKAVDYSILEKYETYEDGRMAAYYQGRRGCAWAKCTWCCHIHEPGGRRKDLDTMFTELEQMHKASEAGLLPPYNTIWFGDDNFLENRKFAKEFFRQWAKRPELNGRYKLAIQTNERDLVDQTKFDEEFMQLAKPYVSYVNLGTESFLEEVAARWNKPHSVKDQLTHTEVSDVVIDGLERHGVRHIHFMSLSDYDTSAEELVKTLRETARRLKENPHMDVRVNGGIRIFPDTEMEKDLAGRVGDEYSHYKPYFSSNEEIVTAKKYGIEWGAIKPKDEIAAFAIGSLYSDNTLKKQSFTAGDSHAVVKPEQEEGGSEQIFRKAAELVLTKMGSKIDALLSHQTPGAQKRRLMSLKTSVSAALEELDGVAEIAL